MFDTATERDVALDVLAILDEANPGRLVGSDETTIADVRSGVGNTVVIELSSGQTYEIRVREVLCDITYDRVNKESIPKEERS